LKKVKRTGKSFKKTRQNCGLRLHTESQKRGNSISVLIRRMRRWKKEKKENRNRRGKEVSSKGNRGKR
jgi:hypothetical protein